MTRISSNRASLDTTLADRRLVLLVFAGAPGSRAESVYTFVDKQMTLDRWDRIFLVENLALLTATESSNWFRTQFNRFAIVAEKGSRLYVGAIDDLLHNSSPDPILINIAKSSPRHAPTP